MLLKSHEIIAVHLAAEGRHVGNACQELLDQHVLAVGYPCFNVKNHVDNNMDNNMG